MFLSLSSRETVWRARGAVVGLCLLVVSLPAQTTDESESAAPKPAKEKDAATESIVTLSPFQVSATADRGYRAGNSVSATRIDVAIKDLPFSVSAFTPQFIGDIGARELFDVAKFSPSVTAAGVEFASGNSVYSIRGFNQSPQRNGFAGEAYVDSTTIERVEVVKGPASVLYGEVAPGGTVNYITKRPTNKAATTIAIKAGSYDYFRASLDYNVPLLKNRLLFRLNSSWENDIQYFAPGQVHSQSVAPVFTWKINDRVSLNLEYQNFQRDENPPYATRLPTSRIVAPLPASGILSTASVLQKQSGEDRGFLGFFPLPDDFTISSKNDRRISEMESLSSELTVKLNRNWTARANFSWSKYKIWFKGTGLGQVNITVPARYFPTGTPYPTTANATYLAAAQSYADDLLNNPSLALDAPYAQMQRRLNLQETFGTGRASQAEITGKYKFGRTEVKPLFGASYLEYQDNTRNRLAPASQFPAPWNMFDPTTWSRDTDYSPEALPLQQFDRGVRRSKAIYGILNSSFADNRVYTVLGGRYSRTSGANDNFLTPTASIGKAEHSKFSPQFGGGWKITPDILVYGSYSTSFQNSIANLQIANVPSGAAAPTTSKGWEVGFKTDLLGGRVSSTVSIFGIEQRDRVINFNTTSPTGVVLVNRMQGTRDRSRGVEVETTLSPFDGFQIYLSGSLNDVKVIETPVGTEYLLGSRPENTVRELANAQARYTFKHGSLRGLWTSLGVNYSGKKAQRVNNPALFTDPYTLLNAAVGYTWKLSGRPASVTLNWDNITDENYVPAAFLRGRPSVVTCEFKLTY